MREREREIATALYMYLNELRKITKSNLKVTIKGLALDHESYLSIKKTHSDIECSSLSSQRTSDDQRASDKSKRPTYSSTGHKEA